MCKYIACLGCAFLFICVFQASIAMAATQDHANFEEAAKQGDVRSQVVMAMSYLYGSTETPKNKTKAVYWLQKAAAQDDVFALNTHLFSQNRVAAKVPVFAVHRHKVSRLCKSKHKL